MTGNPNGAATGPDPLLQARGLVLSRGRRRVLDGVSLELHAGEWLAVVGPNGAGKSSLMAALAGLLPLDGGDIRLCGRPLAAWTPRERATRLAWLAQQPGADGEIPAREVVRLGRLPRHGLLGSPDAADEAAVDRALADTEAAAYAARPLSALSGGERQRVLLARALAVQAPVLLLDEPGAHLDAPHQRALLALLRARGAAGGAAEGTPARVPSAAAAVLHDLSQALAADRVLVLAAGRVAACAPAGEPGLHRVLEAVFDDAVAVRPVTLDGRERFVALPRW